MKKLYTLLLILITVATYAQVKFKPLTIGDKIPERMFRAIPKKVTTKLIIIDMWTTSCSSCMAAFPKMNSLQNKFERELQIVLMNPSETNEQIKRRLVDININLRKAEQNPIIIPELPGLNKDHFTDELFQLFPARGVPHHVWLDNEGIVKAITQGYNATEEHIKDFLSGKNINMAVKNDMLGLELQQNGAMRSYNSSPLNVYYSAFLPFSDATVAGGNTIDTTSKIFRYWENNRSVVELFQYAFVDINFHGRIILEMRNKTDYVQPPYGNLTDDWMRKHAFNYEIQLPIQEKDNYRFYMKEDLNRFFGQMFNITGGIEKRKFKSYVLIRTDVQKLKTTEEEYKLKEEKNSIRIANPYMSSLASYISLVLEDLESGVAFIDETGADTKFRYDIKLEINKDTDTLETLRAKLKPFGLGIYETDRTLDVLVIKDKLSRKI